MISQKQNKKILDALSLFFLSLECRRQTDSRREGRMLGAVKALGWEIRPWPLWIRNRALSKVKWISEAASAVIARSGASTPNRVLYISDSTSKTMERPLPLLAHEMTHALQSEMNGRFWWTLYYIWSRKTRFEEECNARASEIIMRARMRGETHNYGPSMGHPASSILSREIEIEVKQLCKKGFPYKLSALKWKRKTPGMIRDSIKQIVAAGFRQEWFDFKKSKELERGDE